MNTEIKKLTADTVMVEVATANLTGLPLRYAVAVAEGFTEELRWGFSRAFGEIAMWTDNYGCYDPATLWEIGGPLIEKHQIALAWNGVDGEAFWWEATHQDIVRFQMGDTPLLAVCRAIVAAKLGQSVSVPQELQQ